VSNAAVPQTSPLPALVIRVQSGCCCHATCNTNRVTLIEVEDQDGKSIRPDEVRTYTRTNEQTYHFYVERRVRNEGGQ
jgi:hypothetical protein